MQFNPSKRIQSDPQYFQQRASRIAQLREWIGCSNTSCRNYKFDHTNNNFDHLLPPLRPVTPTKPIPPPGIPPFAIEAQRPEAPPSPPVNYIGFSNTYRRVRTRNHTEPTLQRLRANTGYGGAPIRIQGLLRKSPYNQRGRRLVRGHDHSGNLHVTIPSQLDRTSTQTHPETLENYLHNPTASTRHITAPYRSVTIKQEYVSPLIPTVLDYPVVPIKQEYVSPPVPSVRDYPAVPVKQEYVSPTLPSERDYLAVSVKQEYTSPPVTTFRDYLPEPVKQEEVSPLTRPPPRYRKVLESNSVNTGQTKDEFDFGELSPASDAEFRGERL